MTINEIFIVNNRKWNNSIVIFLLVIGDEQQCKVISEFEMILL